MYFAKANWMSNFIELIFWTKKRKTKQMAIEGVIFLVFNYPENTNPIVCF